MPQRIPLALPAFAALASFSYASGTRVGFQDAFATARGNAFVATADNPSAIYYNPAGIARLEGTRVSANLYSVSLSSDYQGAGGSTSIDEDPVHVPAFYTTWKPEGANWTFGFGMYAPFGLETEWPAASPLRTLALRNEQEFRTYNFSAAWQVSPSLSLGGSLTYNRATTDLRRGIGVFGPNDLFRFEGDGDAFGANLGVLWQVSERNWFGVSYAHSTRIRLEGESQTLPVIPRESASATFEFPEVVIAGWSFRPTPDWNLEVNLDWTNWDRLDTVTIRKPSGAVPLPFNWESGLFYEFGVTRYFGAFNISAGYCFTENSVPSSTYTPAVPDSDRAFYSLGIGYHGERYTVDLAYHYADGGKRRVSGSPASLIGATADGTYDNSLNALALSFGLKF